MPGKNIVVYASVPQFTKDGADVKELLSLYGDITDVTDGFYTVRFPEGRVWMEFRDNKRIFFSPRDRFIFSIPKDQRAIHLAEDGQYSEAPAETEIFPVVRLGPSEMPPTYFCPYCEREVGLGRPHGLYCPTRDRGLDPEPGLGKL